MSSGQKIYVVDDDAFLRAAVCMMLESKAFEVRGYASAGQFLADSISEGGCLIADIHMPGMNGLEMQEEMVRCGIKLPVIFITGRADVTMAVRAMAAGAIDFVEKPFDSERILGSVRRALEVGQRSNRRHAETKEAQEKLALLTPREHNVLEALVNGRTTKRAAHELGISPRTVEIHRARIMDKTQSETLSTLIRYALCAKG